MMRTGGRCAFMVRICTGEVCVRSSVSAATWKRVLHVARGMIVGEVQRREVVVVRLDLGPLRHREAEPLEDLDDLVRAPA